MSNELLSSKIYFPAHRPNIVQRQRLFERLDTGLGGKLTLVSAPAGFGKTTLVSEWLRHSGHAMAWVSLDKNDNDLPRFLTYLVASLQQIDEDIGIDIAAALAASQTPQFETLLTRLVNEIEVLSEKTMIVLDDYHLIDSKSVHDALNFLIEYLPPTLHLVLVGRADPPLPISRLRVRGEVNEIRSPELRFTRGETATFLNDLMGFNLTSDDIAALEQRTEGWVASLQLAALSMQGREDHQEFIATFSGSHRYVIDYLVDEVMARQPESVQKFLRGTSILERFCMSLCEVVVGENVMEGMNIIETLERSNLFLIPLDDHREWYRYHHLFAEFLRQRLRDEEPEHIPDLRRRASQWFEAEGLFDEAIQHALDAGEMEEAARLVDEIAADLIVRREPYKLLNLLEKIPSKLSRNYPLLCILHAWALLFLGRLEEGEHVLGLVEARRDHYPKVPIGSYTTTVRAYLANYSGDFHKAIRLAEGALEEMSGASSDRITLIFRGSAVIWLGVNYRHLGYLDKAEQLFIESTALNQEAGNIYAALASFEQLAELALIRGQLHKAMEFFQSGLTAARNWVDEGVNSKGALVAADGLHAGLGFILYQKNDLVGAAAYIQRGFDLNELGEFGSRIHSYRKLAFLKQAEGDYKTAYELLRKAWAIQDNLLVRQSNAPEVPSLEQLGIILSRAHPEMAHLLSDVSKRLETLGLHLNDERDFSTPEDYPKELEYADLVRVSIAQNQAAECLPLIDRLLMAAHSTGRMGDEIRYLVLSALAHHAEEDTSIALKSLTKALTLAEPQGYIRLFVDEGAPMAELLQIAVSQNIEPEYAKKLLAAFPEDMWGTVDIRMVKAISQTFVEPLSERELEVLRLIAAEYKYKEVAERLVISLNTVRHHTRNIYRKLNVNSRSQVIARAKELDLL